jgi:hypothetical protein
MKDPKAVGFAITNPNNQSTAKKELGVNLSVGTYVMNAARFSDVSVGYFDSGFVHEGVHIRNRENESYKAERRAYEAQYGVRAVFNLSPFEVDYIRKRCGPAVCK